MTALFNTTFFFSPAIEQKVHGVLARHWLPACEVSGCGKPVCLTMDSEQGVCRLAIQTPFPSEQEASRFADAIAAPLAAELTSLFGAEAFTAFSTIMKVIDLK